MVVSNHASYIDGVVFTAALPPRFGFVIKREMNSVPLAGLLLRRLGSEFVERFNRNRGAADARRVLRNAVDGNSLVFFPGGHFPARPGTAEVSYRRVPDRARAGCPVVPATVRGTRVALSPSGGAAAPGRIVVEILPRRRRSRTARSRSRAARPRASCATRAARRIDPARELGEPDLTATCSADTAHPPRTAHARSAPASRP